MGLGRLDGVLDNRSLRTKIAAAVLTAILSGVIVGVVAATTIGSMNEESAAARHKTVAVLSASGTFAKNVEAFSGGLFALQLYPQAAGEINEGLAASRRSIDEALDSLATDLAGTPELVAKARSDWVAFTEFLTSDQPMTTPEEFAKALQEYNTLYGALSADQTALQENAEAMAQASITTASDRVEQRRHHDLVRARGRRGGGVCCSGCGWPTGSAARSARSRVSRTVSPTVTSPRAGGAGGGELGRDGCVAGPTRSTALGVVLGGARRLGDPAGRAARSS